MNHPHSLLQRAASAAAALVATSAALLSVGSSPARVDQNTDIKFGPVTLTYATDRDEAIPVPGRQLYKGDWFYLNVDLDATRTNPKSGQSFTIDLPEPFVDRDDGNSHGDMIGPLGYTDSKGTTIEAGECKVNKSRIACTFGDTIESKLDVVGKIQTQLLALGATSKTSSVLTINGKEYTVAHPRNEGIALRPAVQFEPDTRLAKGVKGVNTDNAWINWRVLLGDSWLKVDYSDGSPVTATDVIQDSLKTPDPATIRLVEVQAGPDDTDKAERVVTTADGGIKKDGYGIQASFEGRTVTFEMTSSLSTDENYRIDFDTRFTGSGRIIPGREYRNQAHLVEANKDTDVFTRSYFESFSAIISYRQGLGGFQVARASAGSAVPSAEQKFDITVAYKLPNGKTAIDFPGWDTLASPAGMVVTVDQTTPSVTLPAGTEITLTEDIVTTSPTANGITWEDPKFSSKDSRVTIGGDSRTATFTVTDQTALPVLLTNSVTRAAGEPPAPPVPNPGNPDPTDSADPGKSDPVDPSESARTPKAMPTPMRPRLPKTGHEG